MTIKKLLEDRLELNIVASNNRKSVDFKVLAELLLLQEQEKESAGGQGSDEDIKENILRKLFTTLNHLNTKPLSFKYLQDQYLSSEVTFPFKHHHFYSDFWEYDDKVLLDVYDDLFILLNSI